MSAFLADFGLAKSVATGSKLTKTGEALGTPAYMSPEQARGEVSSLTPATDVWSLGCVLYEMLAGRRPFEGETDAAVVGQVLLREPPRLRALRPDLPPGLERLLRAAMEKRWAQAREALRAEPGWEAALPRGYVEGEDAEGDKGAAVREYNRGLDGGMPFAWALSNRGLAREAQGDLSGAIEDFGNALEAAAPDWSHRNAVAGALARVRAAREAQERREGGR
ncbi:MAG: protein kinase [Planctomycetales bacterium]|nr:protein kinase [Planctomycetales bacterium]